MQQMPRTALSFIQGYPAYHRRVAICERHIFGNAKQFCMVYILPTIHFRLTCWRSSRLHPSKQGAAQRGDLRTLVSPMLQNRDLLEKKQKVTIFTSGSFNGTLTKDFLHDLFIKSWPQLHVNQPSRGVNVLIDLSKFFAKQIPDASHGYVLAQARPQSHFRSLNWRDPIFPSKPCLKNQWGKPEKKIIQYIHRILYTYTYSSLCIK